MHLPIRQPSYARAVLLYRLRRALVDLGAACAIAALLGLPLLLGPLLDQH